MYFDRNISENKYGKKNEGSYLSCVTNGEFYFRRIHRVQILGAGNIIFFLLLLPYTAKEPEAKATFFWIKQIQSFGTTFENID